MGGDDHATRRVLDRIESALEDDARGLGEVRASFGTARAPDDGIDRDTLVAAADRRLYEHKRRGPRPHPHISLVEDA
jgi:GGDEF domain-containing protein